MNAGSGTSIRRRGTDARNKRLLAIIAAIAIAPVLLSYLAYYAWPRDARVNYGTLITAAAPASIAGTQLNDMPFATAALRGRWIVLYAGSAACDAACAGALYASRQARTIQNAERERIERVWLVTDDRTPPASLLDEHPDLVVARAAPPAIRELPQGTDRIYLIDPLGNFVLAWPSKPDIKAMARDLTRLLRASRIG